MESHQVDIRRNWCGDRDETLEQQFLVQIELTTIEFEPKRDAVSVRGRDSDPEEDFQIRRDSSKRLSYSQCRNVQVQEHAGVGMRKCRQHECKQCECQGCLGNIFARFSCCGILVLGIQIGLRISLLHNNKNPQLLHRFYQIGFFRGHLSKNNCVKFFSVC